MSALDSFDPIERLVMGSGPTTVTALAAIRFGKACYLATRTPAGVGVARRQSGESGWQALDPVGGEAWTLVESVGGPFLLALVFAKVEGSVPRLFTNAFQESGVALAWMDTDESFRPVTGFPEGYGPVTTLLAHESRLFVAVAGDTVSGNAPALWWSEDPVGKRWRTMAESPFGDPAHAMITHLIPWRGQLYVAVANAERGAQLWRAGLTPEGVADDWRCVLRDGAGRYTGNRELLALTVWDDQLYLAAGRMGQTAANARPLGVELLRVDPENCWEILAGGVRFTPDGLKAPLASLGSGFGDPAHVNLLGCCSRRDALYVATSALPEVGEPVRQQLWVSHEGERFDLLEWPGPLVAAAQPLLALTDLGDSVLVSAEALPGSMESDGAQSRAADSVAVAPDADSLPPGLTLWRWSL